jgi:hypothetical protein
MKLKEVKEPPLLNPPSADGWRQITPDDWKLMMDNLGEKQKNPAGWGAVAIHYFLMKLGMPREMTPEENSATDKELAIQRDTKDSYQICNILYMLTGLGKDVKVLDSDLEEMEKKLQLYRGSQSFKPDGRMIAFYHHNLSVLGRPQEITPADREKMADWLDDNRQKPDPFGWDVADIHYRMKKLGIKAKVKPKDVEAMKAYLQESRAERKGWHIALMHHFLNEILGPIDDPNSQQKMPSIKRFGGVR